MKSKIIMVGLLVLIVFNVASCNGQTATSLSADKTTYNYDYYTYDAGNETVQTTNSSTTSSGTTTTKNTSSSSTTQVTYDKNTYNVNTDWFMNAKYGIFVHYVNQLQNNKSDIKGLSQGKQTSWDECVNSFNVDTFAKNANETGAYYVMFSVLQVTKYMIAPNATYNKYTGYKTGEACSTRDLIADLIKALDKYNIKLMLYFTGDGPSSDAQAAKGLKIDLTASTDFRTRWYEVAKEYSLRYGNKIYGWWVDGSHLSGYTDTTLGEFSKSLKAGNPNSIVAFNPGGADQDVHYFSMTDDYTAGERNSFTGQIPKSRFVNPEWVSNRKQWHILSFLGSNWAETDVKYTPRVFTKYVQDCNQKGGVVTIDVGVYRDGSIGSRQLNFLKNLKSQIRK